MGNTPNIGIVRRRGPLVGERIILLRAERFAREHHTRESAIYLTVSERNKIKILLRSMCRYDTILARKYMEVTKWYDIRIVRRLCGIF